MNDSDAGSGELERLRQRHHSRCFVSRPAVEHGLDVHFAPAGENTVEATVLPPDSWEGYDGVVHGGIIAALLDGAMVNALFARGTVAVTAEVTVRYWLPLLLGQEATVSGCVARCEPPLYLCEARIQAGSRVYATAKGKFMRLANADA